ncbi:hypothetical protein [Nocardia asteroides]|uniref:hypothetical protein n=1 Tax=Nocardia asteroides TaxID=1824 RepID=UPI001E2FA3F5|nr:hypothetical protein [Nocardia asteroides]UGT57418.1 hypothetical protein LTT85_11495 [Nocardia asteroides]
MFRTFTTSLAALAATTVLTAGPALAEGVDSGSASATGSSTIGWALLCGVTSISSGSDSNPWCTGPNPGATGTATAIDLPLGSAQDGMVIVNQILAALIANTGTSAGSAALSDPLSGSACALGLGSGGLGPSRPDPCSN